MRAVLANPDSAEPEKTEATASLQRLADAGNEAAVQILTELGLLASQPSAFTASRAKEIICNPASTPEQRTEAWVKLKTAEGVPAEVRTLERELLDELHRASIADVDYGEVHTFCDERKWTTPAVRSLFFDRWLPAYWKSEQGSKKLAELEAYGLMHNNPGQRSNADIERFELIAELRRRIRLDEEFCGMLAQGVSEGEIPMELINLICSDIWAEPKPTTETIPA
jgi:hypothetical protein